mmetsp:Transcript_67343/g.161467  ORF Transcript_67343/g.161467 Transcript_67343/m.161467 type:complete len:127 (-) Transcript_67343:1765-2145(-)
MEAEAWISFSENLGNLSRKSELWHFDSVTMPVVPSVASHSGPRRKTSLATGRLLRGACRCEEVVAAPFPSFDGLGCVRSRRRPQALAIHWGHNIVRCSNQLWKLSIVEGALLLESLHPIDKVALYL